MGDDSCRKIGERVCREESFTLEEANHLMDVYRKREAKQYGLAESASWEEINVVRNSIYLAEIHSLRRSDKAIQFSSGVFVEITKEKEIQSRLLNPHYSDSTFKRPQTVYIASGYQTVKKGSVRIVEGAFYNYSDLLSEWYKSEDRKLAWQAAEASGFPKNSAGFIEAYLRELLSDPHLNLVQILAGHGGDGYPYQVYGCITEKTGQADVQEIEES